MQVHRIAVLLIINHATALIQCKRTIAIHFVMVILRCLRDIDGMIETNLIIECDTELVAFSLLGDNLDDTTFTTGTIKSGCGGTLHHLDGLDIRRVDIRE